MVTSIKVLGRMICVSGKGTYTYKSGAFYKGEWLDDKKSGQGVFDWKDGSKL